MKLTNKVISNTQHVCLFGPPKVGKTQIAGALAEKFKLWYFDLDNGYNTLKKLPIKYQENIELIGLPDTKVFPIGIETMLKVITGNECKICEAHGKVSCMLCLKDNKPITRVCLNELGPQDIVVTDSGTQLAVSAMNHITKNQNDDYKFDWDDYRKQGTLMDKFLSQLQQSKCNHLFITHESEVEMEDGKKKLVPVAGTTNFSRNTARYFDHIVYAEVKNKKHVFASATTYAMNVLTGSRTDAVLEKEENPTLFSIFGRPNTVSGSNDAIKQTLENLKQ